MALDLSLLSQDLVIINENSKKVIVIEVDGEPIFLKYRDLVGLVRRGKPASSRKATSNGGLAVSDKDGNLTADSSHGTGRKRSLTRIGSLCGEIIRSSPDKVMNARYGAELQDRLFQFDGSIPEKCNSQVGHILREFLDEWKFEWTHIQDDIAKFLQDYPALENSVRKRARS